jgi:hypothetical protein
MVGSNFVSICTRLEGMYSMDEGSQYIKGESGIAESQTPFLILVRYSHH